MKFILPLFAVFIASCQSKLSTITELPKSLQENSGIVSMRKKHLWLIEDSGNTDQMYETNFKGKIIRKLKVKNATNKDWEDLTKDPEGNVYIGDIGNNQSKRKDLVVYKIPNPEKEKGKKIDAEKIRFYYPEQKKFPPKKKYLYYDAESLFYKDHNLYIVTKNRSQPFNGTALIYKIPAVKGHHKAQLIDTLNLCTDWNSCQVTSADISPDGTTLVLLSYGKLFIISDFIGDAFSKGRMETIDLGTSTQLEAVCFLDPNTLLLTDEKKGSTGKKLYTYELK